ncbi:excisionase family DNA-binding protein [bacterium]|nr:excisionase family DNA-binding protein [bacterium]
MSHQIPSINTIHRAMVIAKAQQRAAQIKQIPELETLSPREAAEVLHADVRAIRRAIRERRLSAFKIGARKWRIRVVDLNKYVEVLTAEWLAGKP